MRPVDLPLNQALGIRSAPAGAGHLLELPFTPLVQNHLGTFHAAAQFALAEAAGAECLLRQFPDLAGQVLAVVRSVEVRYRQAATSDLHAFGTVAEEPAGALRDELRRRGRAFVLVNVELRSPAGALSFAAGFKWYLATERTGP